MIAYFLNSLTFLAIIFVTLCLCIVYFERNQLYRPAKQMTINPQSIGILYEDVDFQAEDGQSLSGWFMPLPDAKITVLFCHGRAGNISDYLAKAKFFHEIGMNLMMFDYRGYGRNSGRPAKKGFPGMFRPPTIT